MIIEYSDGCWADIDTIHLMKRRPDGSGVVCVAGGALKMSKEEYTVIEKAYRWQHSAHAYGKDLKQLEYRGGGGKHDG
jgi:hypothetical protein